MTSSPPIPRNAAAALFILLLGTFAYFHHPAPGWNVNSRLALTAALVERGTVRIDGYFDTPDFETGDVAAFGGHHYSDKAIGTSLLGVPAYAVLHGFRVLLGLETPVGVRRYIVTVFSVGLCAAAAGVVLARLAARLMRRAGAGDREAVGGGLAIAVLLATGTQMLFYSTLFMAYMPAVLFALLAFERFEARRDAGGPVPWLACGVLMGLAVLCEYLFGALAVLLALVLALSARGARAGAVGRGLALYTLGALAGIAPFIGYTMAVFGTPAIPYQYHANEMFRDFMARGVMGATVPKAAVLWLITFHPYRGLFVHSPFLVAAVAGLFVMARRPGLRAAGWFGLLAAGFYLLFNAGYYMWWGGWSFGPRHLIPMLPFLGLGLVAGWRSSAARAAVLALAVPAVALHMVVVAVDPQFRDLNPMTPLRILLEPDLSHEYIWLFPRYIWPLFKGGDLGMNGGRLLGLQGPASLVPLAVWWLAGGALLWVLGRRSTAPQTG